MKPTRSVSLKNFNTFGVDAIAKRYVSISEVKELQEIVALEKELFVLSGGSNLLLTQDLDTLVVHLNTKGKELVALDKTHAKIKVQAGENWHEFVLWCLEKNYGGLENLSLIPGNVGTSPIQNIGAYGVEVKDRITEVEALEIATGKLQIFENKDCHFGYRESVFKNKLKGQYILTSVTFQLSTKAHQIEASYGAIQEELALKHIFQPTPKDISAAVIKIRNSKLPNPKDIGNSGSFFKNPVVGKTLFTTVQKKFKDLPYYVLTDDRYKIPAGWLIEQCGFKGKRFGTVGVHEKQALVLVNYGSATGKEVIALAQKIQASVLQRFAISLEMEVNVI
jgi:UDP-N-acetylmuramate dehydrogenase